MLWLWITLAVIGGIIIGAGGLYAVIMIGISEATRDFMKFNQSK